jgi:hypothetical protein
LDRFLEDGARERDLDRVIRFVADIVAYFINEL